MQEAKVLKNYRGKIKPFKLKELEEIKSERERFDELLFFKHHCSDKWLKKVVKRAGLKRSRVDIDEVRRLLIEAVKLKMEK